MDVKQLEYFRAIVDAGTISGAARVLHMTQPPLSYQVKMLEEELQVQLFLRGTKKITLTEAGKTSCNGGCREPSFRKKQRWDHARGTVRAETDPVPPLPQLSVVRVRKKGAFV